MLIAKHLTVIDCYMKFLVLGGRSTCCLLQPALTNKACVYVCMYDLSIMKCVARGWWQYKCHHAFTINDIQHVCFGRLLSLLKTH